MEEWLRCNTCFRRMKNSSRVFYLTGCDHVFCSCCVDGDSKQCPKCDTVGVGIIPIREMSSRQTMYCVESVSSHAKILIERPRFSKVQYLILSRYAWKTDEAYDQLVKFTEQLIEAAELSLASQKRLIENLAKYRRLPIDVAPPTTNERNVPVTEKPTLEIFSNNAWSQVCNSRELPQKSDHDRPQLAEPKSEYFPKNVQPQLRNWRKLPQTSTYHYPQAVEAKSECFSKYSQPQLLDWRELPQTSDHYRAQLDELKSEYSSKKSQSRRRSSMKSAKPSKPSCLRKKRRDHENIWQRHRPATTRSRKV